jgi:uncharacterized membrane protein
MRNKLMPSSVIRRLIGGAAAFIAFGCAPDLPTEAADPAIRAAKGTAGGGTKGTAGIVVGTALPSATKRDTTINVRIIGSGFDRNMTARWAIDGIVTSAVAVNSTRYVSATELVANITVSTDAPLTEYDIIITSTKGGKPGIGTEIFEIVQELDLGSLGGDFTSAAALNESGVIVGYSSYWVSGGSGPDRPVVWTNGVIRDLLPTGYTMGRATDVNDNGTVVGWVVRASDNFIVPFTWTAAQGLRVLPTLAGQNNSGAMAINDLGIVAGYSGNAAVIWENGVIRVIRLASGWISTAVDINSSGTVVAYDESTGGSQATQSFRWDATSGVQYLQTLNGSAGIVRAINDQGTMIGNGPTAGDPVDRPFVIEDGVTRELTSAFGRLTLTGLSEAGHITAYDGTGRGILRDPAAAEMIVCNPVTPAQGFSSRCAAYSVDNDGNSVGMKTDKYGMRTKGYRWQWLVQ